MKAIFNLCSALVLGLFGAVPSANAIAILPTVVYDLTSNHCTVQADCGAPGTVFGTVTLAQNGANVDLDVHVNSPYVFITSGAVDFQNFIFNGLGVVLGDITVDAHVPALAADTGVFGNGGVGTFQFGIFCASCGNGIPGSFSNDILFHVANATIADLTVPNAAGNVFVADIGNTLNGATGPIDATIPHNRVPEPASLALLGLGLAGLGFSRGKKQKSA